MQKKTFTIKNLCCPKSVLALGPESDGNFCICKNNQITYFYDLGDLIVEENFLNFKRQIDEVILKNKIDIILTDLHHGYNPSKLGAEISRTKNVLSVKIQHHIAHANSAIFSQFIMNNKNVPAKFTAIICDGTGLGEDGKIWGGEVFIFQNEKYKRIGSLEEQIICGGDASINQPARMLISFLSKIFNNPYDIFTYVKRYYSQNQVEVILNQIKQNFNCVQTTSTGRTLDSISLLLGLCSNIRAYKHEPVDKLIENSTQPYALEPELFFDKNKKRMILSTTRLFEFIIKNINLDKSRLAATAQRYLANGLLQIAKKENCDITLFGGGMANNPHMAKFMKKNNVFISENIACGDKGLSVGQIMAYLLGYSCKHTD